MKSSELVANKSIFQDRPLPKTLFPFIWYFLREYKFITIIFIFLGITAGFWGPFNSMILKHIINLIPQAQNGDVSILMFPVSLIVVNFIVFDNFTWRGIGCIHSKFVPIIVNRVISQSMNIVLGKSHQFYQDNLSGKISKQIGLLSDGIERLLSTIAANFLRGASLLFTGFITAYFVNPIFCFILIIWFVVFTTASILMLKKLVSLSDKQASAESIFVGELVDSLSNHSNVRMFARRSYEILRMIPFLRKHQKAYTATNFYALTVYIVQGALISIMLASSSYFLVYLYSKNLITMGDFVLILGLSIETGHMTWYTMSGHVGEFNQIVGRCKQSLLILMTPRKIKDKPNAIPLKCKYGRITFDKVKFSYKGSEPLFQNKSIYTSFR